jgi:hypothetical protein
MHTRYNYKVLVLATGCVRRSDHRLWGDVTGKQRGSALAVAEVFTSHIGVSAHPTRLIGSSRWVARHIVIPHVNLRK